MDVVIPMQKKSVDNNIKPESIPASENYGIFTNSQEGITVLCGDPGSAYGADPLIPFDELVCAFLSEVSSLLMKSPECRTYPDVITFGFFCRKGNISTLKKSYKGRVESSIGKGLVFHIAPSNVPINFAYSLVAGLLAGDANIVKASSRDFSQVRLVANSFSEVLNRTEYESLRPYVNVIIYHRERKDLTEFFSSQCNVRVIWGGDATIATVKKAPIPPRATDICFADRYSLAVIKASSVLSIQDDDKALKTLAQDFYNDTYLYDQNACSSPHMIYWLGEGMEAEEAKTIFWQAVYDNIKDRYFLEDESAVDKRMAICRTAIAIKGSQVEKNSWETESNISHDNRITRMSIPRLDKALPDLRCNCGFWQEYTDTSLNSLAEIIDERYQTLGYYGCDREDLRRFVVEHGLKGIDRIVPLGHTADFSLVWDGYDLIGELCREIFF